MVKKRKSELPGFSSAHTIADRRWCCSETMWPAGVPPAKGFWENLGVRGRGVVTRTRTRTHNAGGSSSRDSIKEVLGRGVGARARRGTWAVQDPDGRRTGSAGRWKPVGSSMPISCRRRAIFSPTCWAPTTGLTATLLSAYVPRVNRERARVTTKKIFSDVYYLQDISNYISNNVS